ncbi:hypothetical protein BUY35_01265 [Staphylococcus cohnii]|uniref:Uncharacterized protein n=1 Tax=Staphylococcus cohnii TaxID=29382 RepID=A0A2T4LW03_9STAP|nr:hypothetical protein BUY36_00740 [Staphylococcus cohnii]PTF67717.1 hypothetical protein BUY34_00490 [Staphylococcus cohnii]PTG67372.1 hypothetical protein BUY28_04890 [Staphylococcus cohnii]RIM32555.1 hypothetical protein BUY35_01265 [Staphylococcus cohnii]
MSFSSDIPFTYIILVIREFNAYTVTLIACALAFTQIILKLNHSLNPMANAHMNHSTYII